MSETPTLAFAGAASATGRADTFWPRPIESNVSGLDPGEDFWTPQGKDAQQRPLDILQHRSKVQFPNNKPLPRREANRQRREQCGVLHRVQS